jgi:hypothetical protein
MAALAVSRESGGSRCAGSEITHFLDLPPPERAGRRVWQPVAGLSSDHDDLPSMVSLVSNEVGEHVSDVERQISPHVSLGHWNFAF